jgi:hypothetical protein
MTDFYNTYAGKDALFTQMVVEVIAHAEKFARDVRYEFMRSAAEVRRKA